MAKGTNTALSPNRQVSRQAVAKSSSGGGSGGGSGGSGFPIDPDNFSMINHPANNPRQMGPIPGSSDWTRMQTGWQGLPTRSHYDFVQHPHAQASGSTPYVHQGTTGNPMGGGPISLPSGTVTSRPLTTATGRPMNQTQMTATAALHGPQRGTNPYVHLGTSSNPMGGGPVVPPAGTVSSRPTTGSTRPLNSRPNDANTLANMAASRPAAATQRPNPNAFPAATPVGGLRGTGGATSTSGRGNAPMAFASGSGGAKQAASRVGGSTASLTVGGTVGQQGMAGRTSSTGSGAMAGVGGLGSQSAGPQRVAGMSFKANPSVRSTAVTQSPQFQPYTVQRGDTLWDIAEHTTGSGSNWQQIYDANKDVIGGDPNLIQPGQSLNLSGSQSLPQTR